jgi:tRNA dimethylallyltransferase
VKILSLLGPTAVGKTALVSSLIEKKENLIFISCDSRKVYRYMDIGTAKPPPPLRKFFSLIDIRNPDETYSAQDFARDAESIIGEKLKEGKIPIVVGGTALYFKALFTGLFEAPPLDPDIRRRILEELEEIGSPKLHKKLMEVDPETARRLHPNDWIRITRALEVYEQTGIPMSILRKKRKIKPKFSPLYIGIIRRREELYERINSRVDHMISEGLVEETKKILEMGFSPSLPSLNTIGYREIILHLRGQIPLRDAVRLIKKRTRIFARKQLYFFRHLGEIKWLPADDNLTDRVLSILEETYG